ncbi:MAG: LecA/PA-IL family lectin [Alphaproteobacteria bacterium]
MAQTTTTTGSGTQTTATNLLMTGPVKGQVLQTNECDISIDTKNVACGAAPSDQTYIDQSGNTMPPSAPPPVNNPYTPNYYGGVAVDTNTFANYPIDVFGLCYYVDNQSPSHSFFAPFNTLREWQAFLLGAPQTSNIAVSSCARPYALVTTPPPDTVQGDPYYCGTPTLISTKIAPLLYARPTNTVTQTATYSCVSPPPPGLDGQQIQSCSSTTSNCVWTETATATYLALDSTRTTTTPGSGLASNATSTSNATSSSIIYPTTPGTSAGGSPSNPVVYNPSNASLINSGYNDWQETVSYGGASTSCGSANNMTFASAPPQANLCSASSFVANFTGGATGPWEWQCNSAANGVTTGNGTTVLCQASTSNVSTACIPATSGAKTLTTVLGSPSNDFVAQLSDWAPAICVVAGDALTISVSGGWSHTGFGSESANGDGVACGFNPTGFSVLPNASCAALLAKIGPNGTPFVVGTGLTTTAPMSGLLYYIMNDWQYSNNTGSLQVTTTRTAQ